MAVTAVPFGQSHKNLGKAMFDFTSHTFKIMLTSSSYTPDPDTHEFKNDVTNEIAGTGYTAGGATLAGLTWLYDAPNDRCTLDCTTPVWTAATFTARRAVIYRDTGTAATSPLLSYVDFGQNVSPSGTDFTITFGDGIYHIKTVVS